ncbi:ftsJ-like methyltransferase [Hirsutella rhossiliensis]|uniref:FtsJ-like methyltransferase domain-containing protein n=1 Tax=Hirsutella rhossiliensis TaxID=111463 RepID=A0A9P8MVH8_9HYPO|nr:ftsJ-like methyltransferase domain-containing protein [Hirsutella rhossiliensis]KAH0961792.1 ftsJ-like methyltransferase domain-containing protein [Hirsutella rhossiliensis]
MSLPLPTAEPEGVAPPLAPKRAGSNGQIIRAYLMENVAEFRELSDIRKKGWSNPQGDKYFERQRQAADKPNEKTSKFFHTLMLKIGREFHRSTKAFTARKGLPGSGEQTTVLDMCMAPGGFLEMALDRNPGSRAVAFSLPVDNGGHEVRMRSELMDRVEAKFLDITMLAADMGVDQIPQDHPEAGAFLPRQLEPGQMFDLIFCDGQVLRTHARAPYREPREARRLTSTQLALGLEHMRFGGTMIVLLHRAEGWNTVCLLQRFCQFSRVRLFKPWAGHAKRSSFYLVATDVRSRKPEALEAIAWWKRVWRVATFGSDDEYANVLNGEDVKAEELLAEFGPELVRMGRPVWRIQAQALAKASFITEQE